jgi:hypothetical protein
VKFTRVGFVGTSVHVCSSPCAMAWLDDGVSIEMSILTDVVIEALTLVLDVLGVEGVDGGSVIEVDDLFDG